MQRRGRCALRMEDLDRPRVMPGAADSIIADLTDLGLLTTTDWMWQSQRTTAYAHALTTLADLGAVFACRCSRKDLARAASAPHVGEEGPPYPGTCRALGLPLDTPDTALRVDVARLVELFGAPSVTDLLCGPIVHDVITDTGDFVIRRRDGLYAYQLAVVVDDIAQGVTEVTRGRDLLSSAPRQALLHRALGNAPPAFAHLPLVVDAHGQRLSKRNTQAPFLLRPLLDRIGAPGVLGLFLHMLGFADAEANVTLDEFAARLTDEALQRPQLTLHRQH